MALSIAEFTKDAKLTGDTVSGTGAFDQMMATVALFVKAEHAAGRLTGPEYATVLLGAIQATTQQAMAYVLSHDKIDAEVDQTEKETLKIVQDTRYVQEQTALTGAQRVNTAEDTHLKTSQRRKTDAEATLLNDKRNTETEIQNKLGRETGLLAQKIITEHAQTGVLKLGGKPIMNSVVGAQIYTTQQQGDGFYWNATLNLAKACLNGAAVNITQDGQPNGKINKINAGGGNDINAVLNDAVPVKNTRIT